MSTESVLRTDILDSSLTEAQDPVIVAAEVQFNTIMNRAEPLDPTKTPGPAKDIVETTELIRQAILHYEERTHVTADAVVAVTYNKPDVDADVETISMEFVDRQPGMFSQGRPWQGKIKNRRPRVREMVDDPDNPGYKRVVLGYFYDNMLKLTCWARTNKQANQRAMWLENVMEEYTYYFITAGVNRILYEGWRGNETIRVGNNTYYGRPIEYFVRTEKLRNVSQKKLEQLYVGLATVITAL
jgi:hypothetical protein